MKTRHSIHTPQSLPLQQPGWQFLSRLTPWNPEIPSSVQWAAACLFGGWTIWKICESHWEKIVQVLWLKINTWNHQPEVYMVSIPAVSPIYFRVESITTVPACRKAPLNHLKKRVSWLPHISFKHYTINPKVTQRRVLLENPPFTSIFPARNLLW